MTDAIASAHAAARETGAPVFTSVLPDEILSRLRATAGSGALAGMPFVVKDNIDIAGAPTTVGFPDRTAPAERHATVVDRLLAVGAVPVAKTNLDQFATGLVGTRSPYGACTSVSDPTRISGGSSSGSAVAVARGLVPLALGTDTAGSGRVPAAFNELVGVKPTRGLVSTHGVFPACRSLDCVTTFTRTVAEGRRALSILRGYDPADPLSRTTPAVAPIAHARRFASIGVPAGPIDLDPYYAMAWRKSLVHAESLGLRLVPVDIAPFLEVAKMLYAGPWLAERYAAVGEWLETGSPVLDPIVSRIVRAGRKLSAVDTFAAFDRLAVLRRDSETVWYDIDALLLPVAPMHPTPAEVAADPVGVNARLGTYTNFVNLLDLCAVAVPGMPTDAGGPFGVQLIAPAFADEPLLDLAASWRGEAVEQSWPVADRASIVLVGAHMSGLPLNALVTGRGGRLQRRTMTASGYRMVRVPGTGVPRPALLPDPDGTQTFAVEVWEVPLQAIGALAAELAAPLQLGHVRLADGDTLLGYVGDIAALSAAEDISAAGGWRAYLEQSS
jgi:allophanate hydrolase